MSEESEEDTTQISGVTHKRCAVQTQCLDAGKASSAELHKPNNELRVRVVSVGFSFSLITITLTQALFLFILASVTLSPRFACYAHFIKFKENTMH